MEARRAFRGSAISRNMVAIVAAVLAAFLLGATGGYLARTLSLPVAATATHVLAGLPGASAPGSAWNYSNQHSRTQTVEGPARAGSSASASFREPGSGRGGPQS
jgi:cell division protein FtsN